MVRVDTSVWIALYRKQDTELGQRIWMLAARNDAAVSGQILVEFLGGFRAAATRQTHEARLRAYPFLETTRDAYDLATSLLATHPRLGAGDAIIAATAMTAGAELWTLDKDFQPLVAHGLILS